MSNVIPFRSRVLPQSDEPEIDLFTAVDFAIRDLREIAQASNEAVRHQADECKRMLERAFAAALREC
jgi:hypothetical protein